MAPRQVRKGAHRSVATTVSKRSADGSTGSIGLSNQQAQACVHDILIEFKQIGKQVVISEMATRFGIRLKKPELAYGIRVADLQQIAKRIRAIHGRNHVFAKALWETGSYEARMLACLIDDPKQVTVSQMNRWARDFDNWAICDTACFHLFDRTGSEMVMARVNKWTTSKSEFVRRAGFALLASFALHDKEASRESFVAGLRILRDRSADDRNFVKKAASWALRGIGKRSDPKLWAQAVAVAEHLAESATPGERWVGKDALKELRKRAKSAKPS